MAPGYIQHTSSGHHSNKNKDSNKNKASTACQTCRKKKVKCSGKIPCGYCSRRGYECQSSGASQRMISSVRNVEDSQIRLTSYENENEVRQRMGLENAMFNPNQSTPEFTQQSSPFSMQSVRDHTRPSSKSVIEADSSLSSCHKFGSQVESLLRNPRSVDSRPHDNQTPFQGSSNLSPNNTVIRIDTIGCPQLPSEERAIEYLKLVEFYIGQTQHYFDARHMSDFLSVFFAERGENIEHSSSLQYLEMVLIFAIGSLFRGDFNADRVPGLSFFEYVQRVLPNLSEMFSCGKYGAEVFSLMAVYLQNSNRKDEAYIHASTALRIAIAHKFHRHSEMKGMLRSEIVCTNRLWWTIYMQEKRLAAATGNPSGVSEKIIELEMPVDALGFTDAAPIRVNIQIAQATGHIIRSLYGCGSQPEERFVPTVQNIIKSLHRISAEVPSDLAKIWQNSSSELLIRTSASLNLMLYQAIILTIRPVMLYWARSILDGDTLDGTRAVQSSYGSLARTCTEAARRLLEVLLDLRHRDHLAIFSFFDFEAAFSAAFIMILTAIFDSTLEDEQKLNPSPGLDDALEILQYLADRGNHFAAERLEVIRSIWLEFPVRRALFRERSAASGSPANLQTPPSRDHSDSQSAPLDPMNRLADVRQDLHQHSAPTDSMSFNKESLRTQGSRSNVQPETSDDLFGDGIFNLWLPQLEESQGGLDHESSLGWPDSEQTLFGDQDWALTGEDMLDFAELGRYISSRKQ